MNAKSRLAQLEKQKPQVKMTWAEFITADVETVDAYAKANGLPTWAEFIADACSRTRHSTAQSHRNDCDGRDGERCTHFASRLY